MIATFESILPIFLLIIAGNLLRRSPLIDKSAWNGLEQLGFWFLYPALLFASILRADFSGLSLGPLIIALMAALFLGMAGMLALWPAFRAAGLIARSEYSTVFQTALRWNGFMALAIAEKLFPPEGVAVVALAMAAIVIPVNLVTVLVVTRFADSQADLGTLARRMAVNPLVLAATAGLLARYLPGGLYAPLDVTLSLVARAALGMGLIAIGAGLRPGDMFSLRPALWLPVVIKLIVYPAALVGLGLATTAVVSAGMEDVSSDVRGSMESDIISSRFATEWPEFVLGYYQRPRPGHHVGNWNHLVGAIGSYNEDQLQLMMAEGLALYAEGGTPDAGQAGPYLSIPTSALSAHQDLAPSRPLKLDQPTHRGKAFNLQRCRDRCILNESPSSRVTLP